MSKSKLTFQFFIVGIIFLTLLNSCKENSIQPELFGTISGLVLDADDNSPIEEANIITNPPTSSILTNESGKFQFENINTGNYSITATKSGYTSNSVTVSVKEDLTTTATIFMTKKKDSNTPPYQPSNPSPGNNSTSQPINLNLSWEASDPDEADSSLFFDVYLYESSAPVQEMIATGITDTFYTAENLDFNTTYFWQVVVKDSSGDSTNGNVWSFTTVDFPDNPIVFASQRDGNYEIYSSDTSETYVIRLTENPQRDWYPRMSPNRIKIAFSSDKNGDQQIFTMDRKGENRFQVTSLPVAGYHNSGIGFSWSPDGGSLIYSNYNKLYRIDQFGTNLTLIATAPAGRHFREVAYSPSGNRIVALTIGENVYDNEIYLMDSNGSNMTLLVDNEPGIIESPSFSIDGSKILFTKDVSGFESPTGRQLDAHIFTINVDGTNLTDLSTSKPAGTNDLTPRFSPDGSKVIFMNTVNDNSSEKEIWILEVNSPGIRTKIISDGIMPDWN